ncbi:Phloem protein 2-like protein [Corchorus capsularis]|uniref:Phloem protein 2-like protein n=1 Tax=Corchorus capsularis TaxID=210143 RepID=A0A1R3K4I6_COCAP|nr:Phloem protein 2-like protein [Corchorus capsularis]
MSDLSSETLYEVVYDVRLSEGASGWELPINLRLSLPNGTVKERQISLFQKPRGEWIELNVGKFRTGKKGESSETQEVCFDLYEHGSHWKHGLVVRSAILRPKTLK